MTRGNFAPAEWKLLLDAPRWVYVALIGAERGSVSTRRTEAKALEKFLSSYKTRSPLVKEIIAGQDEADDKLKGSLKEAERMLGQVGTLLERRADGDEGDAVRDMLMQAGQAVAEATREALIGDAESAKEEKALARVETALKATDADKRRRREAAAAEAERRAKEAKEAEARAVAARKREEAARAEAEKKAAEAEAKRRAAEAEAKRKAAEAEAKRKAAEAEAKRKAAEAEAKRKADEAEAKRKAAEAEAKRKAAEAEAKEAAKDARRKAEAEAKRKAEEAEARKAAEAAAAAEAERIYVVKKGDTLSHIALEVYGNAGRWREIFEANRDIIKKPNLIRPGWKLRIPD
ncbi:MAG: LysM peptidoglycan-binding domain-containing protein [Anaerolineae bacterium]|jgi:colicin import membrane protein